MRIKNWEKFQHYRKEGEKGGRKPQWIKIYLDLLNDLEWHKLSAENTKILVGLWLLSGENYGELPGIEEISFRLRTPESKIKSALKQLEKWVDTNSLADCYQDASPEEEEKKKRKEKKRIRISEAEATLMMLNEKARKQFRKTQTNLEPILARMDEGYQKEDFEKAIINQCREWKDCPRMDKFLRPSTLFQKTKFDSYVNNNGSAEEDWGV